MMICPHTKNDCDCNGVCQANKTSLAEIERLVDALKYHAMNGDTLEAETDSAALMAAIQKLFQP